MTTRRRALLVVSLLAVQPASLDATAIMSVGRDAQRDMAVTIYNGNLGLVKDVREVRLAAALSNVRFMDVAAQIDPTTVHLRSLTDPRGLRILEQNYEYDLLSSQKLMDKYVGRKVRLYQSDGTWHEATLLSTQGPVCGAPTPLHAGPARTSFVLAPPVTRPATTGSPEGAR